jgi:hypothetical protein
LGLAPAALLLSGLFTVWAGPLAAPVAAAAPTGVVVAWGYNGDGESDVPAGLSGVTAISAGATGWNGFSLALKSDGTVVAWGANDYGQSTVPADLSGVTAIAGGGLHNLALKSNGTVVAWGNDSYGQTDVPAGLSGVTAIAAGSFYSLALKSNGTVVAWGDNPYGGGTDVPAGLSGVIAIAAGWSHSLALKSDGTVVGWGCDYSCNPIDVPAGLSGVIAIAAGGDHSLALKVDGTVVAWGGDNIYGETDVPAGLSGVTAIAAANGFSLALKSNGTVVAWGSDYSGDTDVPAGLSHVIAIAGGGSHSLALVPSPAATLTVSGIANPYVVGVPHSVTVTAKDADGNTAIGYRGKVHFTSSDPAAMLPADYTFTAADAGVHTFSLGLTLNTAGTHWVRARDTVIGSITGAQSGIVVTLNPVQALAVSGIANPYVAGVSHSVTVAAKVADGATYAGYRGTVRFTSTDPAAVLPADYTFTAADAGVHTFSITLNTAGDQGVRARDTVTSIITGAKYGILVTGYPVATLTLSGSSTAGVAHNFTVTAKDAAGNTDPGYRGTMHFTSTDRRAILPPDYTFTATDAGIHVFSVTLKTSGAQVVRARDTLTSAMTGAHGIVVAPAAATTLTVSGLTSPRTHGTGGTITVTARDAFGNTATGYRGTVHFTSTDYAASRGFGSGFLPADYTFTAASAGTHTFNIDLVTVGTQAVRARDTVTSTITGLETGIVVT